MRSRRSAGQARRVGWALLLFLCGSPASAKKIALLVGIGDYLYFRDPADLSSDLPPKDLKGPRQDVALVRELLIQRFGFPEAHIRLLQDHQATQANLEQAFRQALLDPVEPGDTVFFYFSGHGSQTLDDPPQDEEDGLDETLVCADYDPRQGAAGRRMIRDDTLREWGRQLRASQALVTFVIDACHSGTASKALGPTLVRPKYLPPPPEVAASSAASPPAPLLRAAEEDPGTTLFAACLDVEEAQDAPFEDGQWHGALTYYWVNYLQQTSTAPTCQQVLAQVRAQVQARFRQTPQLSGPRQDQAVLGGFVGKESSPSPPALSSFPRLAGAETEASGLRVWIEGFGTEEDALAQALQRTGFVTAVEQPGQANRLLRGGWEHPRYWGRLELRDGTEEAETVRAASLEQLAAALRPALVRAYLLQQVMAWGSPHPALQPELDLVTGSKPFWVGPDETAPTGPRVRIGDSVRYRFRAAQPCYVALLNIGSDGSLVRLFPNDLFPAREPVQPHTWYAIPEPGMGFQIRAIPPAGREWIVAVASRQPLDFAGLRLVADPRRGGLAAFENPLQGAKLFGESPDMRKREEGIGPGEDANAIAVALLQVEIVEPE